MLVSPGLAEDLDAVAVLGEAVDERDDAGGTRDRVAHRLKARLVVMIVERCAWRRLMLLESVRRQGIVIDDRPVLGDNAAAGQIWMMRHRDERGTWPRRA